MSKNFFCENCGMPLNVKRKALKYKQVIVELVPPHLCNTEDVDKYLDNITDAIPNIPKTSFQKVLDDKIDRQMSNESIDDIFNDISGDKRDSKDLHKPITTSAPSGILNQVKAGMNSVPEGDINDL